METCGHTCLPGWGLEGADIVMEMYQKGELEQVEETVAEPKGILPPILMGLWKMGPSKTSISWQGLLLYVPPNKLS